MYTLGVIHVAWRRSVSKLRKQVAKRNSHCLAMYMYFTLTVQLCVGNIEILNYCLKFQDIVCQYRMWLYSLSWICHVEFTYDNEHLNFKNCFEKVGNFWFGLPSAVDICIERVELLCVGRSYNVHEVLEFRDLARISKLPVFLNNIARPKWRKMV